MPKTESFECKVWMTYQRMFNDYPIKKSWKISRGNKNP